MTETGGQSAERPETDRDEINAKRRARYRKNRDQERTQQSEYKRINRDKILRQEALRYQNNSEVIKNKVAEYRRSNQEPLLRKNLQEKYSLSLEDYREMEAKQNGVCRICKGPPTGGRERLSVDHRHTDNRVRGLLCSNCNAALGLFQDSPEILDEASSYLKEFLD